MRELNTPEGAQDRHGRLHRPETQSSVLICPACGGKGTYLGQIFHAVQPCPKCCGEGFDKTMSQFSVVGQFEFGEKPSYQRSSKGSDKN